MAWKRTALALGAALTVATPLAAQDDTARQADRETRLREHQERIQQILATKRRAQEDPAAAGRERYRARVAGGEGGGEGRTEEEGVRARRPVDPHPPSLTLRQR